MVLGDSAKRNSIEYPNKTAVVFQEKRFTFKEINNRINRLANAFKGMGVRKGERVAILAQNCHQYVETFFACAKAGLVILPLNAKLAGPELSYIINDASASLLIIEKCFADITDSIRSELKTVNNLIIIGDLPNDDYQSLIAKYSPEEPDIMIDEDDLFCLLYTSGTTGKPKGVMLTHKNILTNTVNHVSAFNFNHEDNTLIVAYLYHIAAQWPLLSHYYIGATSIILKKFEPEQAVKAIERERVTTVNAVPIMIEGLLNQLDMEDHDLSSLRWIGYGASPMPIPVLKRALDKFGPLMVQVYGLTESGGVVTWLSRNDHVLNGSDNAMNRTKSCGKSIVNVDVKVVNESGNTISSGQVGEIIVKGENIMKGYWSKPQATKDTIKEGYLYTGDLATVDEEGYIYIIDRKKDMIISGGENVYSREIEDLILTHPAVNDVAVIGIPDKKWGESVKAVVILQQGKSISEDEIIKYCRHRIAGYKIPKSVEFVSELPRNSTGKLLKKELREKYVISV